MFRLECLRSCFVGASRFAAKDCRAVSSVTVSNSRSPRALLFGGYFIWAKDLVGEFMRIVIAVAALAVISFGQPALAEEAASHDAVRIEINQKAKAFVFIIDDKPVAMLDKNGFQVVEHLSYGRSLTDKGPDAVRREIAERLKEAADE